MEKEKFAGRGKAKRASVKCLYSTSRDTGAGREREEIQGKAQ